MTGCGAPLINHSKALQTNNPIYATVPTDSAARPRAVVEWLAANGITVEKADNGDWRVFDSPDCRIQLASYRRLLHAQLDVIAENIANMNNTHEAGNSRHPYQRKIASIEPAGTLCITRDPSPYIKRFDPKSADADAEGYVLYPNVDQTVEMANATDLSREYELTTRLLLRFDPTYVVETAQLSFTTR